MIKEFDKVVIKSTGVDGVVIDIYTADNEVYYTVESNEKGVPGGWGQDDNYKLFTCKAEDLKKV